MAPSISTSSSFAILCRTCGQTGFIGDDVAPTTCPSCHGHDIRSHPEMFDLNIAHIDCDAFYASVEKRDNPELRDRPVIVGGGDRGVVAAACYIARKAGVHSAMPTWRAIKKCPDAVIIRPRMNHYVTVSRQIRDKMFTLTPLVQPVSIDEAFLDLSGTRAVHRCSPVEALVRLQSEIRDEIGITVSIGLSGTKSLAKMASDRDKPDGLFIIGMDHVDDWLAGQDLGVLYGLGKAAIARLNAAGFYTCGDLATADMQALRIVLGKQAGQIQELARGIDPRPVAPNAAAKSISSETTFNKNLSSFDDLEAELEALCLKVSTRLKEKDIRGSRLTIKLKRANHQILTRSKTMQTSTNKAHILFAISRDLVKAEVAPNRAYRLLGVGVDQFGDDAPDASLFDMFEMDDKRADQLEEALDQVTRKLGQDAVISGRRFQRSKKPDKPT
ncbi:DNA polymerase IV [Candidatus Puniceispirillum sp.]|uniref:DNA polymerase IV n=1 Tax=Candidatus Puniceispirillum sp. TaxID=2026719 RepID=UPI003F6A3B2C